MANRRKITGQCQVGGCPNLAKYALFRTNPDGKKEWLKVCSLHEGIIGNKNLRRAGGSYEHRQGG